MTDGEITYQSRIHESNSRLSGCDSLFVDSVEQSCEDRGGGRRSSDESRCTLVEDDNVVADRADIWISSTNGVKDTSVSPDRSIVDGLIGLIWGWRVCQIVTDSCLLVRWNWVDV